MINIHRTHWELGPHNESLLLTINWSPAFKLKGFKVMVETIFSQKPSKLKH